jgi:dihydroneopterin aldolase
LAGRIAPLAFLRCQLLDDSKQPTMSAGKANSMVASKPRSAATKKVVSALPAPRTERQPMRLFIRDLVMSARIGVHQHERVANQRIRLNLELEVEIDEPINDELENTVCYGELMTGIRHVIGNGHVNLVETLCERIADMCFADRRIQSAKVRIEKLDVFPEALSVGIEVERRRPGL